MHWISPVPVLLIALLVLVAGCKDDPVSTSGLAESASTPPLDDLGIEADESYSGSVLELADSEVYFEFNTTDNDLGLQIFLDGEGWHKMRVFDPTRDLIVNLLANGNLAELGITELRFESAEPSPAEVLSKFPPGTYRFRGRSVDGDRLVGEGTLSHDFAPPPVFTPANGEVVEVDDMTVEWEAPGADLVEIILESDSDAVFDVIVEGDTESLDIPEQFLEPDTEYKIELLVYAENGNRTIAESTFVTEAED